MKQACWEQVRLTVMVGRNLSNALGRFESMVFTAGGASLQSSKSSSSKSDRVGLSFLGMNVVMVVGVGVVGWVCGYKNGIVRGSSHCSDLVSNQLLPVPVSFGGEGSGGFLNAGKVRKYVIWKIFN